MSALAPEVRDLLAAIREALDVPLAALTDADEEARARLLHHRASSAKIACVSALDPGTNIAGVTERLTQRTADSPVTYRVWQPADGGEQS